jgi:hydroxymethylpyrimidine pyrophosphatase-like HAD family hydrolase
VVATDLDGTLWDSTLQVGPRTRAAVRALAGAGIAVLAATARRPRGARELLEANGLSLPIVGLNGAMGRDAGGAVFHDVVFRAGDALAAYDAFARHGLSPTVYVGEPDVDVVLGPEPSTHPDHVEYLRPVARLAADLEEVVRSRPVYGLGVVGRPPAELEPAVAALAAVGIAYDFAPEPLLPGWGVNAMPPGISKWSGIEAFCAAAGLTPEAVLAVGDGTNDVPMLERAALPVVVAGSRAAVRLPGADVIAPPERDGWAELAARLLR